VGYWRAMIIRGPLGSQFSVKVSKENKQKHIKIEEDAQTMHGKKQKVQFDESSRFGGNTSATHHASGTSGHAGGGS
jgi:hypothetical protein